MARVRQLGLAPIEVAEVKAAATTAAGTARVAPAGIARAVAELAILLQAGLPIDRALGFITDNLEAPGERAAFAALHQQVKEGVPLSQAMAAQPAVFPPMAPAMAEAGEASGALGATLARLGDALDRAESLRQTVRSAMIYPLMLVIVASGVILAMLLFVVPQFEGVIEGSSAAVPATTAFLLAISKALRAQGWLLLLLLPGLWFALRLWWRRPGVRAAWHRLVLRLPYLGPAVASAETARFAQVLGSLVDGGVQLPVALAIAGRSIDNTHMRSAVAGVAQGLKEGAGLARPLAATRVFPRLAIGFITTGEESAQLGPMLARLADILDRDVRQRVQRLIGILTPTITVVMGVIVATIIASIMTAILGINDLALAQ